MTISKRSILLTIFVLFVVGIALLPSVASACPGCKDLKSDSDYLGGTASLPRGFFYSILLMVSAPFAVAATFVTRIVLARRRLRASGSPVAGAGQDPRDPAAAATDSEGSSS